MQALRPEKPTLPLGTPGPFDRIDPIGLCAAPRPIDSFDFTLRY